MKKELTIVGGIPGFQAFSTQVVTNSLVEALEGNGVKCRVLTFPTPNLPATGVLKWALEVVLRYVIYPAWCRKKISPEELVYITDHANATVVNWLKGHKNQIVVHCHDLTSLRPLSSFPYELRLRNRLIYLLSILTKKRGLKRADKIIAISNFTKAELIKWLNIPEERITVAHNGIDHQLFRPLPKMESKAYFDLTGKVTIMSVGPASYRKNLVVVAKMLPGLGFKPEEIAWLHVGKLEDRAKGILSQNGYDSVLQELTGLTSREMQQAYSASDVFLFPSLYEGFGLPPVEAMACGTPVVASNCAAIPEILGDACLYCPPHDIEKWTSQTKNLLRDKTLYEKMVKKGLARASLYTWDEAAKKIIDSIF